MADSNPIKLCECGCGKPTPIAKATQRSRGHVKGQPIRFIQHHAVRLLKIDPKELQTDKLNPTYASWRAMTLRCTNPKHRAFKYYGARGITICERWKYYPNFRADMGRRPEGMTLDRIDSDGNYEPSNCRWSTIQRQQNNRRDNRMISAFGQTKTLSDWARSLGLHKETIRRRLNRGWTAEHSLGAP